MNTSQHLVTGICITALSAALLGQSAPLSTMQSMSENCALVLEEFQTSKVEVLGRNVIRYSKLDDMERIEWWGANGEGETDRQPLSELTVETGPTPTAIASIRSLPNRTLAFDGFRQVDWFLSRSKRDPSRRSWAALAAAEPTLHDERPGFLRLMGLGRLGTWLWDVGPDGRKPVCRQLATDLLMVGYPVGDPEAHAGLFAFDLIYLDRTTGLPQRIVEHMPATLPPDTVSPADLADLVFSEIEVEERHANGIPRRATWIHRSAELLDFRWVCHEAAQPGGALNELLADSSHCPVEDTEWPIRRADQLTAVDDAQQPRARAPEPTAHVADQGVEIGTIGLALMIVGGCWAAVRALLDARNRRASVRVA